MKKWLKRILQKEDQDKKVVFQTSNAKESFQVELKLKQFGIHFDVEIDKPFPKSSQREYKIKVLEQDFDRARDVMR